MSTVLAVLLATVIDLGRAHYTAVVVSNMAGEGAAYAALYPDQEEVWTDGRGIVHDRADDCSLLPVPAGKSIRSRVSSLAKQHNMGFEGWNDEGSSAASIADSILIYVDGDPTKSSCTDRRAGHMITVRVTYRINDLFMPGIAGLRSIPIVQSATQRITRNVQCLSGGCNR
jgi:hypothetical protein